jgi:hypothetical protein
MTKLFTEGKDLLYFRNGKSKTAIPPRYRNALRVAPPTPTATDATSVTPEPVDEKRVADTSTLRRSTRRHFTRMTLASLNATADMSSSLTRFSSLNLNKIQNYSAIWYTQSFLRTSYKCFTNFLQMF